MSDEGDVSENENNHDRYRRANDARPVEVHGYGNGAKKNAIINTIASVGTTIGSFVLVFTVIWWGSKIDTRQGETINDVADIKAEQAVAAQERRELSQSQVQMMELYVRVSETLDKVDERGEETRDIAIRLDAIEQERRREGAP